MRGNFFEAICKLSAGLSLIPVDSEKRPRLKEWTPYQTKRASQEELKSWFAKPAGVAVVCGKVSGGLEVLDFDCEAKLWGLFCELVEEQALGLLAKLVVQRSQHNGRHIFYRCPVIEGNQKLAHLRIRVDGPGDHEFCGKKYQALKDRGEWVIAPCGIETRGEGGYILIEPSNGYKILLGNLTEIPTITPAERNTLIECARALNEYVRPEQTFGEPREFTGKEGLPGTEFNTKGDIRAILEKHGWCRIGVDSVGRERWRRPGKNKGHSATLIEGRVFYVFSNNAPPFEADKAYTPFAVYTLLEHEGDFAKAAKSLQKQGFGSKTGKVLKLTPLAEVQTEVPQWLWEPYIPLGKVTLLEGDPGVGKTFVALAICAKAVEQGHCVIYASCEDGAGDTLKPRILKMSPDLDLRQFFILEGIQGKDGSVLPFTIQDIRPLEEIMQEIKPKLVVLDPLQGFLGPGVDFHKANEVRTRLAGVIRLAEKYACSFLVVRHLNKNIQGKAVHRGIGSIDFSALARSILLVGHKDNTRVVAHVKSSLAEKGPSLAFTLDDGVFKWTGETPLGADELLEDDSREGALEEAMEFLRETLSSGPVSVKEVFRQARSIGIADITLRRAKKRLGVTVRHERADDGKIKGWAWVLPHDQTPYNIKNDHLDHLDKQVEIISNLEPGARCSFGNIKGRSSGNGPEGDQKTLWL